MRPSSHRPPLPSRLVGRDAEIKRLGGALSHVRVAVVYGVGGIGKSAFVLACADALNEAGDRPSAYQRCHNEPLGEMVDELRRVLAGEPVAELADDEDRLDDLAERLEQGTVILVLDDLHALSSDVRHELIVGLGLRLRDGCVLAASRERVARRGGDPDRVEVHLDGLDESAAQELWTALDELYGSVSGFAQAAASCRGNPFLLRRAHAGGLDDDDPIAGAVKTLAADERKLAAILAVADRRIDRDALAAVFDGDAGAAQQAARRLSTKLLADVDGAGALGLDELFREALFDALGDVERRQLHAELVRILPAAQLDLATEIREVTRHLVAAGDLKAADGLLVQRGAELVRIGASGTLRRSLDAIDRPSRSSEAQLTYARCLYRTLELERSFAELERLVKAGSSPRNDIRYSYGTVAFTSGRVTLGVDTLAVLLDGELTDPLRLQVTTQYGWLLAYLGRVDEARDLLLAAERDAKSEDDAALLAFYRAVAMWSAERDDEMKAALERARALDPAAALPFATSSDARLLLAVMSARLGNRDGAQKLLEEAGAPSGEDRLSQVNHARMRGTVAYELGDLERALPLLSDAASRYREAGSVTAVVTDVWVAKTLLALGRRAQALVLLDDVSERADNLGLVGTAKAADRAREAPVLVAVGASAEDAVADAECHTVVDARLHELRSAERSVSLKRRKVLRKLLYALARKPNEVVTKEQLAEALWQVEYHPLRHDNGLWVNVRRLRELLEPTDLAVEQEGEGYLLRVGASFAFVPAD